MKNSTTYTTYTETRALTAHTLNTTKPQLALKAFCSEDRVQMKGNLRFKMCNKSCWFFMRYDCNAC